MQSTPALSSEELLHLALQAGQHAAPDRAMTYLKQLIAIEPLNAQAHYLLGAFHADIGMFPQAAAEIAQALALDPDLSTARFQLGLLHLTAGELDQAMLTWEKLEALDESAPLRLFKEAMLCLVRDEFNDCIRLLEQGIENNTGNDSLSRDMERVLKQAQHALESSGSQQESNSAGENPHLFLSAYNSQADDQT